MSKRRVTSEQMADMLNQPHFNNVKQEAPINNDPITTMPMVLEVMQVKQYDKNPRKAPNSEYQNLYESIKVNGLDQAITITKRPGDAEYMVYSGGNTRLKIIQELWNKTQDPKYKTANFLFKPWGKEEDTLLAHLRENDQRGELNFIDRANALLELKNLLIEEGVVSSDSKFAEYIKEAGYSIARQDLSTYWFAAEELYEWLPNLLNNGMGRNRVKLIYSYKQAYHAAFNYLEAGNDEQGELHFYTVVEKLDEEDKSSFDDKALWGELIESLHYAADKPLGTCGIVLTKALQDKNSLSKPLDELARPSDPLPEPILNSEPSEAVDLDFALNEIPDEEVEVNFEAEENFNFVTEEDEDLATQDAPAPTYASSVDEALDNNPINREEVVKSGYSFAVAEMLGIPLPQLPNDIAALRSTACELARQLLEKAGLNRFLVQEIPDGAGFILLPITPKSISETLDTKTQNPRWLFALHTWLELTDFSGQFNLGSKGYKYIPAEFCDAYPAYTKAMVSAEKSTARFTDYELGDWGDLQQEGIPYLSGLFGREQRLSGFLGSSDLLTRQTLASYFQLIEVYRELNRQLKGVIWEL